MENYGDYRRCQYCNQVNQYYDDPTMQPLYNDNTVQPYNDQMLTGQRYADASESQPDDNQMIGEAYNLEMENQTPNNQMAGQPMGNQMIGQPMGNQMIGQPMGNQMIGQPMGNQMNGQPSGEEMIGEAYYNEMADIPLENNSVTDQDGNASPMPYYQTYGYPQMLMEEQENEDDMDRLKEMYPETANHIMTFVEAECDKLEYEGSFMFDEHPDVNLIIKIRDDIYDQVKDKFDVKAEEEKSDTDEVYGMNWEKSRRRRPHQNWLGDMIDVILINEMHRRRCRFRNCRGRW